MRRGIFIPLYILFALPLLAAPSSDSPLWESWDDTPMIREWKVLMQKEAWKNNTLGIDHEVPPPWTPLTENGGTIEPWGRSYNFAGKALPVQIVTQKEPLLSSAVRFTAVVDGKEVISDAGSGRVTERFQDKIVYEGECSIAGIPIKVKSEIEFDGFVWMSITTGPAPSGIKLERLSLDFPLRRDIAQFYRKQSNGFSTKEIQGRWGKITKSTVLGPLNPGWATDFGVANDKVGIEFGCESMQGYLAKDFARRAEWILNDKEMIVRFTFINDWPADKGYATAIELFYNVMPYRPVDCSLKANFIYSWEAQDWAYDAICDAPSPCVYILNPYFWGLNEVKKRKMSDSCIPIDSIPIPRNPEKFLTHMKRLRMDKPERSIIHYVVGDLHNDADPVFTDNSAQWLGSAEKLTTESVYQKICKQRSALCRSCGWSQELADYKVYVFLYWAEKLDLDGYYWDDQCYTPCLNPDHKEHHFLNCNGEKLNKRPIRTYREMAKRVYKEQKKRKPHSVFIGHGLPPYTPFSDMVIDGEVLRRLAGNKNFYTHFIQPEDCRNFYFNGYVDGSAKSLLPEYSGKYYTGAEAVPATRAMLCFLWMTDMNVWINGCSARELFKAFINPRGTFGVHEAEYLPYWKQRCASFPMNRVYCTVYKKKDRALLIVSNWNKTTVNGDLHLDLNAIFATPGTTQAFDAETRKPMDIKTQDSSGDISLEIPPEDFRLIEVKSTP